MLIGHADVAFTMKQYILTDLEADRQVANTLAELIIGGSLASIEIADKTGSTGLWLLWEGATDHGLRPDAGCRTYRDHGAVPALAATVCLVPCRLGPRRAH